MDNKTTLLKTIAMNYQLSMDKLVDDANLREDLAFDSMAILDVLMDVEDAYGVVLSHEDKNLDKLVTLGDLITLGEKYAA